MFSIDEATLSWTEDRYLTDDNGVVTLISQAGHSFSRVNVEGILSVKFNVSKKSAGNSRSNIFLWAFVDSSGNIISRSDLYTNSAVVSLTDIEMRVPQGALYLYTTVVTTQKASGYVTKITFDTPQVIKGTIDYVSENKEAIDFFGGMVSKETLTPNWSGASATAIACSTENGKFSAVSTGSVSKVVSVNVEGILKVGFYASIMGGGSASYPYKTYYVFNDSDGNNILRGPVFPHSSSARPLQRFDLEVPEGATRLLISLLNSHQANYGNVNTISVEMPASIIPKEKTYDVENGAIKAFRSFKYNNNDYSFSWVGRLKAMNANYDLPAPIVIDTPVDTEAQSRTLLIADNANFTRAWEIGLDLVSKTKSVYNLEPQRWYWWKVIKDEDSSDILGNGNFFCEGQIRELVIGAGYTEAQKYHSAIQNARDIGGWQADGGRMRYGVLFRGHELDTNGTDIITAEGKAELLRLGVGVELDLRGSSARTSSIDSSVKCIRINVEQWFHHLSVYQSQQSHVPLFVLAIRAIIEAAKANKAIYAHCQGGCDRTGALCWVIEGLCGVSENDLAHDFELSDRPRKDEFYSRQNGDARDSDYKFAMDYVKGLVRYNNHIYTKSRCYDDTFITIGGVDYKRSTYEVVEDVKYFRWLDNVNDVMYCTTDVYPTTYSKVYDESYVETSAVITKVTDKFWYDCQSSTHGLSASRITDASLIASLESAPKPKTLKEKFALLMQIVPNYALGDEEIEELRNIFVS